MVISEEEIQINNEHASDKQTLEEGKLFDELLSVIPQHVNVSKDFKEMQHSADNNLKTISGIRQTWDATELFPSQNLLSNNDRDTDHDVDNRMLSCIQQSFDNNRFCPQNTLISNPYDQNEAAAFQVYNPINQEISNEETLDMAEDEPFTGLLQNHIGEFMQKLQHSLTNTQTTSPIKKKVEECSFPSSFGLRKDSLDFLLERSKTAHEPTEEIMGMEGAHSVIPMKDEPHIIQQPNEEDEIMPIAKKTPHCNSNTLNKNANLDSAQCTVRNFLGQKRLTSISEELETCPAPKKRTRTKIEDMDPSMIHVCTFAGCNKKFAKKYNLKIHERRHNGDLPFLCKFRNCGKRFMWMSSFSRHQRVHEARNEKCPRKYRKNNKQEEDQIDVLQQLVPEEDQGVSEECTVASICGMEYDVDHRSQSSVILLSSLSALASKHFDRPFGPGLRTYFEARQALEKRTAAQFSMMQLSNYNMDNQKLRDFCAELAESSDQHMGNKET